MATLPLVIGKMLQSFAGVVVVNVVTYHLSSPPPSQSGRLCHQVLLNTQSRDLCRFVKDPVLWACLAGLAVHSKHLDTAEVAYAAIQEADKVVF